MVMIPKTVRELIDHLETYPDDLEVFLFDTDNGVYDHITVYRDRDEVTATDIILLEAFNSDRVLKDWIES